VHLSFRIINMNYNKLIITEQKEYHTTTEISRKQSKIESSEQKKKVS